MDFLQPNRAKNSEKGVYGMYSDDKDLVAQFSAYLKVSIKHARQEYLVKRAKIKSN